MRVAIRFRNFHLPDDGYFFVWLKNIRCPNSLRSPFPHCLTPLRSVRCGPPSPVGTALRRASALFTFPSWDTFIMIRPIRISHTGNLFEPSPWGKGARNERNAVE